ncbi:MAG: hypothetical protein EOO73_13135 [Myxococcales bacterium]|nr:MAG: hypothetical protein EOO73_13135 [Myxococcales bacterium]
MSWRRRCCVSSLGLVLLGSSASALAQASASGTASASVAASPAPPGSSDNTQLEVSSYCRYVEAVGESNSALLLSPTLFATFSNIPTSATGADDSLFGSSRARLQLGVGVSPTRMYRGLVTNEVARTECRRYASQVRTPVVPAGPFVTERSALVAKIRVLEEAITTGQTAREKLRAQLDTALATVEEYGALVLQLDGLNEERAHASARLALLPVEPTPNSSRALAERARAEDAAQEAQAKLRRSQALELDIRAGYYRIFGVEQKLPVFAMATLEFSPGWLWQSSAEERARQAHRGWVQAKAAAPAIAPELPGQLRDALAATQRRAQEVASTTTDLEARRVKAQSVPGEHAQHFATVLWLQLAKLRAEQAYLNEYAATLQRTISSLTAKP